MPQKIVIDLNKNKEVADVVADLSPGDKCYIKGSVAALDKQTLTVELEEVSDSPSFTAESEEEGEEMSEEDPADMPVEED
jgi:hypothetical protein